MSGSVLDRIGSELSRRNLQPISAAEILATTYPALRWAVEGIMPEGFALLAGHPKIGKSWLALNMAVSVSHGTPFLGKFPTVRGRVLYAALEDGQRRIQSRLRDLGLTSAPPELEFLFDLPKIDDGGLEALAAWLDEHKDTQLAIIDVFNRIRGQRPKGADAYQHDSDQAAKIQKLATTFTTPTLLIHHDRKADSDDWLEKISGTLGTSGTADAVMLLERDRDSANGRLRITGRDLEDRDLGLEFRDGLWQFIGPGETLELTPERRQILDVLPADGDEGFSPTQIKLAAGMKSVDTVKHALPALVKVGLAKKTSYGRYVRGALYTPHTPHTLDYGDSV